MTTDDLIMQEMLDRATNPNKETIDEVCGQMFCMLVKNNVAMIHKALDMIVMKLNSQNITEATRAISVLEDCMTSCGSEFQDEVAKNRFLNNFIRLVLKKYDGARTPLQVKQRIMECLLLWTTEYSDKLKIRIVYDMLSKESDVELSNAIGSITNSTADTLVERESILGKDEHIFKELLNSKDPNNYMRANILVQSRLKQENRRTDLLLQRKIKLQEIQETVSVLTQMLDNYDIETNGCVADSSLDTMHELYSICKKHKPILKHLIEIIDNVDDALIAETIEMNELLRITMERYQSTVRSTSVISHNQTPACDTISNSDLIQGLFADTAATTTTPLSRLSEKLSTQMKQNSKHPLVKPLQGIETATLEELNVIFTDAMKEEKTNTSQVTNELLMKTWDILEPLNVSDNTLDSKKISNPQTINEHLENQFTMEKKPFRELPDIDQLSETLIKQNLMDNERVTTFKKEPEKLSLNDLVKEKIKEQITCTSTKKEENNTVVAKVPTEISSKSDDDCMMLDVDESHTGLNAESLNDDAKLMETDTKLQFKHLKDITIDLDDVIPLEERILLEDSDVRIAMNLTDARPSQNVSVIVMSIMNKSKASIKDIQMEGTIKKPCKIRLLEATENCMAPCKTFRPPPIINQVVLIFNPTGKSVDIAYIVSYKLGDDPDPIKELIDVKGIPYVH